LKECSTARHRNVLQQQRGKLNAFGYHGKLYVLAFDHRGSFQKKWFGLGDEINKKTQTASLTAKNAHLRGPRARAAARRRAKRDRRARRRAVRGDVPRRAKERGIKLAMPVEKSGQNEFDFQYGDDFGAHMRSSILTSRRSSSASSPDDPDTEMNTRQLERLKRLADWLTSTTASSSSNCSCRPPTPSSSRWAATRTAMTPSSAPS